MWWTSIKSEHKFNQQKYTMAVYKYLQNEKLTSKHKIYLQIKNNIIFKLNQLFSVFRKCSSDKFLRILLVTQCMII